MEGVIDNHIAGAAALVGSTATFESAADIATKFMSHSGKPPIFTLLHQYLRQEVIICLFSSEDQLVMISF